METPSATSPTLTDTLTPDMSARPMALVAGTCLIAALGAVAIGAAAAYMGFMLVGLTLAAYQVAPNLSPTAKGWGLAAALLIAGSFAAPGFMAGAGLALGALGVAAGAAAVTTEQAARRQAALAQATREEMLLSTEHALRPTPLPLETAPSRDTAAAPESPPPWKNRVSAPASVEAETRSRS